MFLINFSKIALKELLPPATLRENAYIAKSVRLEQFIMEGSYNKVNKIYPSFDNSFGSL
jgi:hypothetical protein